MLKYLFPIEYGLHNPFFSIVTKNETTHQFLDYTDREEEIAKKNGQKPRLATVVPKRLEGIKPLVEKWMKLHSRTSYHALIKHYCPSWVSSLAEIFRKTLTISQLCDQGVPCPQGIALVTSQKEPSNSSATSSDPFLTQGLASLDNLSYNSTTSTGKAGKRAVTEPKERYPDYACTQAQVSAFARACIANVFPKAFFGGNRNDKLIMKAVDHFISLGKHEAMSLNNLLQGLHLQDFTWLVPPGMDPKQKMSLPDRKKRMSLLSEFLYYLFDSYLIPLLGANFFISDAASFKTRAFYFRHDVWKKLCAPVLSSLMGTMFEEVSRAEEERLKRDGIGIGKLRLLPKEEGVRPIINLRRKGPVRQNGKMALGKSVNDAIDSLFKVLAFEKVPPPPSINSSS